MTDSSNLRRGLEKRGAYLVATLLLTFPYHGRADDVEDEDEPSLVQCQEKPAQKARAKQVASDLFGRAERAFNKGQYAKSLRRFLCSLYIIEHEATLANIEAVLREMDHKELALRILKDYVAFNPDGELTPNIRTWIADLEQELGKQDVAVVAPAPCEEKVVERPPPVCVTYPDTAPMVREAGHILKTFTVFSIGLMGAGAASLIAGGVLQGLSIAQSKEADTADRLVFGGVSVERKRSEKLQVGAIAAFAAGAVTVGIGTVEFLIAQKKRAVLARLERSPATIEKCGKPAEPETAPEETVAPEVTVGLGSIRVGFRF